MPVHLYHNAASVDVTAQELQLEIARRNLRSVGPEVLAAQARAAEVRVNPNLVAWANHRNPNICLLASNVFYILTSLAVVIIGFLVIKEHSEDFSANAAAYFVANGEPTPCGLPTPDAFRLLQALGAVPAGGITGALVEPDYGGWIGKIEGAVCSRIISGVPDPDPSDCAADDGVKNYDADHAEELNALAALLDDSSFMPVRADIESKSLQTKLALFDARACLQDVSEDGVEPFYTYQQRDAYGDLKVRVTQAYLTAMPSFSHYKEKRSTCWTDPNNDPFNTNCKHACNLLEELQLASEDLPLMLTGLTTGTLATNLPDLPKMLYRLLALSLAGYSDRRYNAGKCFENMNSATKAPFPTAKDFCSSVLSTATLPSSISTLGNAIDAYSAMQRLVGQEGRCVYGTSPPPPGPPPAPDTTYTTASTATANVEDAYKTMCAHTLQYGLFEQGRLFGIPDVDSSFVVDSRTDSGGHFLGTWIYNALYIGKDKGTTAFDDAKLRLQLYIGYRLAGTAIWGMQAAAVAGFLGFRGAVPTLVFALRLIGVKNLLGTSILLLRPEPELPVFLTLFVGFLSGYWMLYVDPATQSHYPVTPLCDNWRGLKEQAPSGVYVTSWGKRRFDRNGEQQIGILMWVFIAIFAVQYFIGRRCVAPVTRQTSNASIRWVRSLTAAFWVVFLSMFIVMVLFAAQAGATGDSWYQAARDTETKEMARFAEVLPKDCTMAIYAAFWVGGAVASVRQKWTVGNLQRIWKFVWTAGTVFLVWMPILQASILLQSEWATATSGGSSGKEGVRYRYMVAILVFTGIASGAMLLLFIDLWFGTPNLGAIRKGSAAYLTRVKEQILARAKARAANRGNGPSALATAERIIKEYGKGAVLSQSAEHDFGVERFSFKFTDRQLGALPDATGYTTGYTTDAPRARSFAFGRRKKDQIAYLPMLQFPQ